MSLIIGPSYTLDHSFAEDFGNIASVLDSPIFSVTYESVFLGDPIIFEQGAPPHDIAVNIPHLPGLDEIELASASFSIASAPFERSQSVPGGTFSNGALGISLTGTAPGQTVSLTHISLTSLAVTLPTGVSYALQGTGGTAYWTQSGSNVATSTSNPGGTVQHLHILIRPSIGGSAGPPIAAAPHFNMPGAGSALYGPALGGANLSVVRRSNGKVDATLTMLPAQRMTACTIVIGTAAEGASAIDAHKGLPTELTTASWSAEAVEGHFDTRAQAITATTFAGGTPPEDSALVANFDTDPGSTLRQIDFAPAARAALDLGYPTASGNDLGLTLRVQADVPGALYLSLGALAARYIQRPLPIPAALSLQGAPDVIEIPVPDGLRPKGLSFRVDGRFGPARLTLDADSTPQNIRDGYRIAGSVQAARQLVMNAKEQTLPVTRLALYGRASEDGEILITRHGGDASRIGPAIAPPVSLSVFATEAPTWHRAAIAASDGLPPQMTTVWITVKATKGVFWWHSDMAAAMSASQISLDDGMTWASAIGRPLTQAWVDEIDTATGNPAPLMPLALNWDGGVLNPDLVGVGAGPLDPEFTRLWVAEGDANAPLFDGIAGLTGPLKLHLNSRRDVDLSVTDMVMTYDPWDVGVAT